MTYQEATELDFWGGTEWFTHRLARLNRLDGDLRDTDAIARRTIAKVFGIEHGMEGFKVPAEGIGLYAVHVSYVSRGDTYDETLVKVDGEWFWTSWGDALEQAEETYAKQTGEARCPQCSTWTGYVCQDTDRGTCCGAIDPSTLDTDDILDGAARALFLSAYADAAEQTMCPACEVPNGEYCELDCSDVDRVLDYVDRYPDLDRAGSGEDWDDVAPDTPEAARDSARRLLAGVVKLNPTATPLRNCGPVIPGLCAAWLEAGAGGSSQRSTAEERFGHCLAMQAIGHGVGLQDDVPAGGSYEPPSLPTWDANFSPADGFFDTVPPIKED